MVARPRLVTGAAVAVGAIVTLQLGLVEFVRLSPRTLSAHVAIETAAALIAALAAYLVFGRFRHRGGLNDLILVYALALLTCTSVLLAFSNLPAATLPDRGVVATWAPIATTFLSAAAFALAAWLPERTVRRKGRASLALLLACMGMLAAILGLLVAFASELPLHAVTGIDSAASGRLRLVGDPFVLGAQLEATVLFCAAAIGFTVRAERSDDELTRWFGVAAVFAAFAQLNYFLLPYVYGAWLATGDLLRLGFYVALVLGAGREIRAYWKGVAEAAVLEERRRIARDLHDGLAQELAFIATRTHDLAGSEQSSTALHHVSAAAERALDESRRAIAALTRPVDEPLDVVLAQAVEEVAGRVGTTVRLDLQSGLRVRPHVREAIVRVAREAVSNAARHGRAREVTVRLSDARGPVLRITDDGIGFDPAATRSAGFGLVSMEERIRGIGGEFRLSSQPGTGTEIEVTVR